MYVNTPLIWETVMDRILTMDDKMANAHLELMQAERDPIHQLTEHYRQMIRADKVRYSTIGQQLPPETNILHLEWMLDSIDNDSHQSLTKKHRWLGFVQCALINLGFTTVEAERNFTRNILNGR